MIRSRFFVGSVLSLILLGSSITLMSCDPKESIAKELEISVVLQETTAIVTATWSYTVDVSAWVMRDEWRSSRVSGGDDWNLSGNTMDGSATFTVPRSIASSATGAFCVTPVRINPQPGRFMERCTDFIVPIQGIPDVEIDSITINVTDASSAHRQLAEEGTEITFAVEANGDTTWRYSPYLADGTILTDHVVQTGIEHTGLQLTALVWFNDEVVMCSGDCALYPDLVGFDYTWPPQAPLQQARAIFPPMIDVLGK